ncbi:MAG TPA: stage III sporulation protein AB [Firmicutes bacterium]|nr:stage III sporulation protein AB [Bacillota bacterium]
MVVKLFGAMLVVLASWLAGNAIAGNLQRRVQELRSIRRCFALLETEISYAATPLPEAFLRVARGSPPQISAIFTGARELLVSSQGYTAGEAWELTLDKTYEFTAMDLGDREILESLGQFLGASDRDDQVRHIRLVCEQLRDREARAVEEAEKGARMWRFLAIGAGLILVLLLY